MTDQLRQAAMQQALEALSAELLMMLDKPVDEQYRVRYAYLLRVITALREALAQPEQQAEPVACRFCHSKKGCWTWQCYHCGEIDDVQQPAPPQREWVGLTEFQFAEIYNRWNDSNGSTPWGLYHVIEKALKAKNHG